MLSDYLLSVNNRIDSSTHYSDVFFLISQLLSELEKEGFSSQDIIDLYEADNAGLLPEEV